MNISAISVLAILSIVGIGWVWSRNTSAVTEKHLKLTKLTTSGKVFAAAISPDGAQAACYFMDLAENRKWRIALVATDSGALIRKLDLPLPIYERQIRFHPSGKFLTQIFTTGENLNLLLLPLDGSEPQILGGLGKGASNLPEWSADGKQFLYPVITETQDAVLLTDF